MYSASLQTDMAMDWPNTEPYKLSSAIAHSIRVPGMLLNTLLKVRAVFIACFVATPLLAATTCLLHSAFHFIWHPVRLVHNTSKQQK